MCASWQSVCLGDPPIGFKGFARWDLGQGHMGCWGEGVGRIWCKWGGTWGVGVKVLEGFGVGGVYGNCPGDERGIVAILGGKICYWVVRAGV
uniref:Uncharacterized protein n=1 Tax=Tanacetum cinerariifolium TaxID=118510 RepID=A0A699JIC6_TANCI|nr:hypothetical protein [Tanacetum cinerariifolium]